jgi:4-diphosphocytidyl-2-C-methyl-D-erythritol kinase
MNAVSDLPPLHLRAYAKINLALAVGPPEPRGSPRPGWHRISSWMVGVSMHDDLHLTRLPEGSPSRLEVSWAEDAPAPSPIDWPVSKDLAFRAHALMEARLARPLPVHARLVKRTPVGGGMGGGSADAAAMLLGLARLYDLPTPTPDLLAMADQLGSDVAFFLGADAGPEAPDGTPRGAVVTGFGEGRTPAPCPPTQVTLFIPAFGCPTPSVYRAFDASPTPGLAHDRVERAVQSAHRSGAVDPDTLFNDLTRPAGLVQPRLREALEALNALPHGPHHPAPPRVHLTGSGAVMFTIGPAAAGQRRLAEDLGLAVRDVRTL